MLIYFAQALGFVGLSLAMISFQKNGDPIKFCVKVNK